MINDGSCFDTIQVVYKDLINIEEIKKVSISACVEIKGVLKVIENSNTTRHVAEFWMLEPEVAFTYLDDIIKLSEEMLIKVKE